MLVIALVLGFACSHAQDNAKHNKVVKDSLPYMKYPEMPAFNLRLMDSTTILNTFTIPGGQPVALFLYDPGCKHCRDVITELMKHMDEVKHVNFYFITFSQDFAAINAYYKEFNMGAWPNIKAMGRDYELFFLDYYGVNSFPDVALYSADKKLIKLLEGDVKVKDIKEYTGVK